jgi:hypothetical protein
MTAGQKFMRLWGLFTTLVAGMVCISWILAKGATWLTEHIGGWPTAAVMILALTAGGAGVLAYVDRECP